MARGRFISKEICIDKKVNSLDDPWAILGFTWLITHADVEGRTYGDPDIVRSLIFPRQPEITSEMVESYIKMWIERGLVERYEADGDLYIEFPNFDKHQVGLRKDKESLSTLPENPRGGRKLSGNPPETDGNMAEIPGEIPGEVKLSLREVEVEGKVEVVPPTGGDNDWIPQEEIDQFCELWSVKPPKAPRVLAEWLEHLVELRKMGATRDIQVSARQELSGKRYQITGPKSVIGPCANVLSRLKREQTAKERPRDSEGEYAFAVNH